MPNPDYAALLIELAATTDPVERQAIKDQFVIAEALTEEEIALFNYMPEGYVENNPGYEANTFVSYVGVYIDDEGTYTGTYP